MISVLVITRNRARVLPRLIAALENQDFPRDRFEIVIVDDGSTDGTAAYLDSLGHSVRCITQAHGGVARARNASARNSRARVLAFTDDDCIPSRNWLTTIHREMEALEYRAALLGHTYSELPSSAFVHSVFKDGEPVVTCNFAVTRDAFEKAGGFDEHFLWYFEDEDLGLRIKMSGVPIRYAPEMKVEHPSRYQNFRQYLKQRSGLQYCYYMASKHPNAEVWRRHGHILRQSVKRALVLGVAVTAGAIWPVAWFAVGGVLSAHIAVDSLRLWKSYARLKGTGLSRMPFDWIVFSLLNWTVPLVDGFQIVRGSIRDGLVKKEPRIARIERMGK